MGNAPQGKGKKLLKDIGIYAVGNLGSKLIMFLLVPFYTHFITNTGEFGYYDLCLTVSFLIYPLLSLDMRQGVFRFLVETDSRQKRTQIISFVYRTLFRGTIIALALGIFMSMVHPMPYLWYVVAFIIVTYLYEVTIQMVRGIGKTEYFVIAGIMTALLSAVFAVLMIARLDMGIAGIFLSGILARIVSMIFLEVRLKIMRKYFRYDFSNKALNREILKYCLPLIPSTLMLNVIGFGNRFFVEYFLGLEANGIFAMSMKFANILDTLAYIFFQAWQENAFRLYGDSDKDGFFNSVFRNYFYFLCALTFVFPFALRINYSWLVGSEYQSSEAYVYILCIAMMFFSVSSFFELGYQCSKKTIRNVLPLASGLAINLAANWFMARHWGLYGISFASMTTFGYLMFYRILDANRYLHIHFSGMNALWFAFVAIGAWLYYLSDSALYDAIILTVMVCCYLPLMPKEVRNRILNIFLKKASSAQ